MKIGELAKRVGCRIVTIRYYEKEGLLPKPDRNSANYRLYEEKEVERLNFIRHCRHHGMEIAEIRKLLAFKDNPGVDCGWINTLIEGQIASVSKQIASLTHLKEHLKELLHKCRGDKKTGCGILESLNKAEACPHCESTGCQVKGTGLK